VVLPEGWLDVMDGSGCADGGTPVVREDAGEMSGG
jgi:hypothetical protein